MESYEQNLHINDSVFERMRKDADIALQRLIKNMVEKDSFDGKITIAIDVVLEQEYIPNRNPEIEGETRRILTPKFSHKVSSVMQVKSESKGGVNYNDMELVWDEASGEYILKPIINTDQMSIFDAEYRCVNDPEEEAAGDEEQLALEGSRAAALPGPMDIVEDDMSSEFDDGFSYEEPED